MSHGEHPLPPQVPLTSHSTPATGYGSTLSTPHSPPSNPSVQSGTVASAAPMAAAYPDRPLRLSLLERWALGASNSQFHALAGATAGFTSGIATCPLDVIKTKLQAQGGFMAIQRGRHVGHHQVYRGLMGTARVIWRDEGVRGMYRGLGPIILGYLPTWAVWFTVYNKSKEILKEYNENDFVVNFWSSIIAGASSTLATNPIWVIKIRMMSQTTNNGRTQYSAFPKGSNTPTSRPTLSLEHYQSTFDAARKMYTTEGLTSFYSGLTPALLGLTHVAVLFPTYEFLKTKFTGKGLGVSHVGNGDSSGDWLGILSASILSKILASSAAYPHEVIRTRLQTQRIPTAGVQHWETTKGATQGQGQAAVSAAAASSGNGQPQPQPQRMEPKYKGIISTFRTILHEEGWRAFYAGMGTNMMRAVPAATVTMLTYEFAMRRLSKLRHEARMKQERADEHASFA